MDGCIKTADIKVFVQENGIIRLADTGLYIGRLDGVTFDQVYTEAENQNSDKVLSAHQYFTDVMTVTIKIDEPLGPGGDVKAKRGALVYKLRWLADALERYDAAGFPISGTSDDDAGFLSYRIEPTNIPVPEEEPPTCQHDGAVMWNPFNQVNQCHRCGMVINTEATHGESNSAQ